MFHRALSTDFVEVLLPEQSESCRGLTAGPALRRHTEPRTVSVVSQEFWQQSEPSASQFVASSDRTRLKISAKKRRGLLRPPPGGDKTPNPSIYIWHI